MKPGVNRDSVASDANTLEALQETLRLQADLMTMFEQREQRMRAAFDQRMQALTAAVSDTKHQVESVVGSAGPRIAESAGNALVPIAARYEREVSATSTQLRRAGRTVWVWMGGAVAMLLLAVMVCASVLGYYRRELAAAKDELGRYEDALPVLQAYVASDATLCGGRLCVNVESAGHKAGDGRTYRQVKLRARKP